jgi:chemosensory pili system protein ChpA (sensor histidine kinase/response regulator)
VPFVGRNTVLVVEDDLGLRNLYRAALRSAGYSVIAVEDGVDALRRIDDRVPGAVVLDLGLPRLNGLDVSRELKSRPDTRHIPIVVVSGTDVDELDSRDFACVLRKPIDADAIVAAVERCLRTHAP